MSSSGWRGLAGLAVADITPPVGIRARNWGAAEHDTSTSVHRPLTLTALALAQGRDAPPVVLVSADLGWWRAVEDERLVRDAVRAAARTDQAGVLVHLSHTHAGPSICREDAGLPGGHLVPGYLDALQVAAADAAGRAVRSLAPAVLEWATGRCDLATDRDLPHEGRYLVGHHPGTPADDTLLVGRLTTSDGVPVGTLVNYACHPTTLAWQNRALSPDYVGAMRELVERATGAPVLFLQGASGELAPSEQYSGDLGLADRHGRRLGHAVLAALEGMLAPGRDLAFRGAVESGAPVALWEPAPAERSTVLGVRKVAVRVPLRSDDDLDRLAESWQGLPPLARAERRQRAQRLRATYPASADGTAEHPVWVWRIGSAVLVAHPGEAYSGLQTGLRAALPGTAVAVANLTNGPGWVYLPPRSAYGSDRYQVWQTVLGPGALEAVLAAATATARDLLAQGEAA